MTEAIEREHGGILHDPAQVLELIRQALTAAPTRYLTDLEACDYLRLNPSYFSQLRQKGLGPRFVRLGAAGGSAGRIYYRQADIDEWMEQHLHVPSPAEARKRGRPRKDAE